MGRLFRVVVPVVLFSPVLVPHPMGNFSISHYARFECSAAGIQLTYALDFAELPTFELVQEWNLDVADRAAIQDRAAAAARAWLSGLRISAGNRRVTPVLRKASAVVSDGAGGLPVLLVTVQATIPAGAATLSYEDTNYAERAGWKEIVVGGKSQDRSRALRQYPTDVSAPPQDLKAVLHCDARVVVTPPPAPEPAPPVNRASEGPPPPGTVVRGDYLSRLLAGRELTPGMLVAGVLVAFGLGAMHALSPGHGKTIVAAYLVGSRVTLKHALFLGLLVTFSHTLSVFLLGFGVLFFERYVAPQTIIPIFGMIAGASITLLGGRLLYLRARALQPGNRFIYQADTHNHNIVVLGVSGGLVPCPSALVLLLSSIALGRVALGLGLLVAFSAGLALVLMGIGVAVLYARHWFPERTQIASPVFRYLPFGSAVVIMALGAIMVILSLRT